jgi:hypothetical protein
MNLLAEDLKIYCLVIDNELFRFLNKKALGF